MERESQVAIIWDQHIILVPKRWTKLTSQVTKSPRLGVARPPLQARTELCSPPPPTPSGHSCHHPGLCCPCSSSPLRSLQAHITCTAVCFSHSFLGVLGE